MPLNIEKATAEEARRRDAVVEAAVRFVGICGPDCFAAGGKTCRADGYQDSCGYCQMKDAVDALTQPAPEEVCVCGHPKHTTICGQKIDPSDEGSEICECAIGSMLPSAPPSASASPSGLEQTLITEDNQTLRSLADALDPEFKGEPADDFMGFFVPWNTIIDAVQRAWDKPQPYSESPLELIAQLIDERDAYRLGNMTSSAAPESPTADAPRPPLITDPCQTCGHGKALHHVAHGSSLRCVSECGCRNYVAPADAPAETPKMPRRHRWRGGAAMIVWKADYSKSEPTTAGEEVDRG